jgi:toxin ParE1/3/4
VKHGTIRFSDLAVAEILKQADWYELQSGPKLATRWDRAVTATIVRISTVPKSGALCRFKAEQLEGTRRVPVAGFPKHLVFYQIEPNGIFVLRVVHGARDLESLFSV